MTASKIAKGMGMKSLKEVSIITGVCGRTLINWFHNKPDLFHVVCLGCLKIKESNNNK